MELVTLGDDLFAPSAYEETEEPCCIDEGAVGSILAAIGKTALTGAYSSVGSPDGAIGGRVPAVQPLSPQQTAPFMQQQVPTFMQQQPAYQLPPRSSFEGRENERIQNIIVIGSGNQGPTGSSIVPQHLDTSQRTNSQGTPGASGPYHTVTPSQSVPVQQPGREQRSSFEGSRVIERYYPVAVEVPKPYPVEKVQYVDRPVVTPIDRVVERNVYRDVQRPIDRETIMPVYVDVQRPIDRETLVRMYQDVQRPIDRVTKRTATTSGTRSSFEGGRG